MLAANDAKLTDFDDDLYKTMPYQKSHFDPIAKLLNG